MEIILGTILVFGLFFFIGIADLFRGNKSQKPTQKELSGKFIEEVNEILNKNSDKILSAYRDLVSEDAFGEKNYKQFKKELTQFIYKKSQTHKELMAQDLIYDFTEDQFDSVINVIEGFIAQEEDAMEFDADMSPYDYEVFCANEFNRNGWNSKSTKGSSDQGVDVIAKRKNQILVAQCKKFAKPVGNKAVQEVVAGMSYYKANIGVVIATNGYTRSAKALASANDIKLIHHSEIKTL